MSDKIFAFHIFNLLVLDLIVGFGRRSGLGSSQCDPGALKRLEATFTIGTMRKAWGAQSKYDQLFTKSTKNFGCTSVSHF